MELPERESMAFDVVVVGAGPAGLSTAIRLKQLAAEKGAEVSVVVVEKGSEVGAHILSGAVIDPIGLDRLVPDWRQDPERRLKTEVARDEFLYLTAASGLRMPQLAMPRLMSNHGNFIGSLGNVCRYLGRKAEELGVEIYPGFPAAEVLVDDESRVVGVATGDLGIGRDGKPKDPFTRGMELRGRYTVFAEGARGNLTKQLIHRFSLDRGRDHQKYGIGIKELWQVAPEKHKAGLVQHSMGWPLAEPCRRRLLALPFRRQPRVGRLRRPSQLPEPDAVALRRVPALQDPPDDPRRLRGRQAHRLRGAGHHGGRLAVGAAADLPGRLPRRRHGRLRQRAAHQGHPQRRPVRHALRRAPVSRRCRQGAPTTRSPATRRPGAPPRSATTSTGCATSSRCGRGSAPGRASRSAASTCGCPSSSAGRPSARCATASPTTRP